MHSVASTIGVAATVLSLVVGCGGNDEGGGDEPDAMAAVFPRDLTCVGNTPTPPETVHYDSALWDATELMGFNGIPGANITMSSLDGATVVASATSDVMGEFSVDIPTSGELTNLRSLVEVVEYPRNLNFVSLAPHRSVMAPDVAVFLAAKRPRMEAIAAGLGVELDPTKGVLEVWMVDCAFADMPGATLSIAEDPDISWVMYTGNGDWMPGTQTLPKARERTESVAAAANVTPGLKHITLTTSEGTTLEPLEFYIEPDTFTFAIIQPGYSD